MSGSFYCVGQLSLVGGAIAGFFPGTDFSQTRKESPQEISIFKIDCINISLAKETRHNFKVGYP